MSYYDDSYFTTTNAVKEAINGPLIWTIISIVLAIVGGVVLYFTVFNKSNESKYRGFMAKIYELVHFKYFLIDDLFKILYIICALAITLLSLNYIGNWKFLVILIAGNVALRISFEFTMLFMELCNNVRNISKKGKK